MFVSQQEGKWMGISEEATFNYWEDLKLLESDAIEWIRGEMAKQGQAEISSVVQPKIKKRKTQYKLIAHCTSCSGYACHVLWFILKRKILMTSRKRLIFQNFPLVAPWTQPWPVQCILQQGGIKSLKSCQILANGSQVWGKWWWNLTFHLQLIDTQSLGANKSKAFHVNCHRYPMLTSTQTPPRSMIIEAITVDSATLNIRKMTHCLICLM